jgi:hypothetical protein
LLGPRVEFLVVRHPAPFVGEYLRTDVEVVDRSRLQDVDQASGGVELPPGGFGVAVEVAAKVAYRVVVGAVWWHGRLVAGGADKSSADSLVFRAF